MSLYPNARKFQNYTQRALGGAAHAFSPYFVNRSDRFCRFYGETWGRGAGGLPSTAYPPVAIVPAITYDGSMAITTGMYATGTLSATAIVSSIGAMTISVSSTAAFTTSLTATGNMAMTILPYTTGSAEQFAYVFWNWVSEGAQSYGKQLRDMRATLLGKTAGGGSTVEVFYAADNATPRVTSTNDGVNRVNVSVPGL